MSSTIVYHVRPGIDAEEAFRLQNSWGSAPYVWEQMGMRYLGWSQLKIGEVDKLWPLYLREDIPFHHRAVLVMTFDRAYIGDDNCHRAAECIRMFLRDFPPPPTHVNHWEKIANYMEQKPNFRGIGFQHTTVAEYLWIGKYNECKEVYDPIDWDRFYDVFDKLEETP
jgi:hypothetical protein